MRYFVNPYNDYAGTVDVAYTPEQAIADAKSMFDAAEQNRRSILQDSDGGGLYVGPAGLAFAMWYARKKGVDLEASRQDAALHWLLPHVEHILRKESDPRQDKFGFLLGSSGVFAVAAVIHADLGQIEASREYLERFASLAPLVAEGASGSSDELLVGRSGYICGALWLRKNLGRDIVSMQMLHKIADRMLQSGAEYAKKSRSRSPLMYQYYGTEYLGAAHGLCSILQMLLSVPGYLQKASKESDLVESSVRFLLGLQTGCGNVPCAMDEVPGIGRPRQDKDQLVHWCHGAPGAIYLFAKAYLVYNKAEYLDAALKCGDCIWSKGLLKKGPGICHGVAGNAYGFLLLYRLTREAKHLYRAWQFAHFMQTELFKREARVPDCPHSLFEGAAGAACFLVDLTQPESAEFPFFDIFST